MRQPTIYFLSYFNSCRSLIAEAWAKKLFSGKWQIKSAGLAKTQVDPVCVKAMKEVNVSMEDSDSEKIDLGLLNKADIVVQMFDYKQEKTPPVDGARKMCFHGTFQIFRFTLLKMKRRNLPTTRSFATISQ